MTTWTHAGPTVVAAFLASLVEFVEALTVVLAVGVVRGWRPALLGAGSALLVLLGIIVILGPTLTLIPLRAMQLVIGTLLLLFGVRWLRKAILRAAGIIALHDETLIYQQQERSLRQLHHAQSALDTAAMAAAFKITMLEGIEVVFIVIALGAGHPGLLGPASWGALLALVTVAAVGVALHRPLARVPENTLKFTVGVLLSAFGTFWVGEALEFPWPGEDWSLLGLVAGWVSVACACVVFCRARVPAPAERDGA